MKTHRNNILRRNVLLAGAVLSLLSASAARAQLVPHGILGPISTVNGYPEYVQDIAGIKLDLPAPVFGDGINPPTMIFDPILEGNPISVVAGFGTEAFVFIATSVPTQVNGGRALLVLGIEAAYGAGEPDPTAPADQFLFARVRVRFEPALTGIYTVTHPWGVEKLEVTAADLGTRFSYTNDWGGFAPIPNAQTPVASSFERLLYSPKQWRFLTASTLAPGVNAAAWIGDGITQSTVTGGLNNVNTFTINGPQTASGAIGPVLVTSALFSVSGHIAGGAVPPPPPVTADTVTLDRARLRGNAVEVRATSARGLDINAELFAGGINGTLVGSGNLGTRGRANISFTRTPDTVRVRSVPAPNIPGGEAVGPVN